jgi:hypothetical protein
MISNLNHFNTQSCKHRRHLLHDGRKPPGQRETSSTSRAASHSHQTVSSETTVRHRTIDRFQEEPVEISDPCAPHTPRPIGPWRRQGDKVAEQAMTPSRAPLLASILLAPDVGRHATDVRRT